MNSSKSFIGPFSIFALLFYLHGVQVAGTNEAVVFKVLDKNFPDIRYEGKWGQICAKGFDTKVAGAICQQIGMKLESITDKGFSEVPLSQIRIDQVECTDTTIDSCSFTSPNGSSKCPEIFEGLTSSLTLKCKHITDVHLISTGSDPHSGLVEIVNGSERGVVCYDSTTSGNVANVACKQMGYSGGTATNDSKPAGYTGKSFDATCASGTEANLDGCTISEAGSACNGVLQVQCTLTNASQIIFDVRLSQSSKVIAGATSGTVEVFQYGKWGVICDTGWNISAANVVCRQLGFTGAVPTTGFPTKAKFGQGTGTVFWNNVECSGEEPSIAECAHDEVFGTGACNSVNASGVICSTETLPTFDICSNETITIPEGVSFLRSPGYPKPFHYKSGVTCSWTPRNLTAATNLTLYIHQKMFQQNQVESLTFYNGSSQIRLYGDDSAAGPFSFTNTDNFTIQFKSDKSTGEGMLNIQIKATMIVKVPSTTRAPTTAGTSGTTSSPTFIPTYDTPPLGPGVIAAIVIGVVLCCGIIIGVLIWWFNIKKKTATKKISKRRNSVGSFDQTGDGSKQGVHNPNFEDGMKKNEIYETADEKGNIQGGTPEVTADIYAEVKPKSEQSKEPETGEMNQNGKDRPASGSHVKICIANPVFNKDEERPSQHNGSPRVESDAQDIDNGNVEDEGDINSPAMLRVVNESHKSPAFIPGLSTAYEEVGFGGASSMQRQPNEETPEKDEKKKKKKKKGKSEDTNKKKKKRSFGTADDHTGHPDGQRNSGSCAVPITGINAEAGQKTDSQPDSDSEDIYDRLNRKGTTPAPSGGDQIYDTAKY